MKKILLALTVLSSCPLYSVPDKKAPKSNIQELQQIADPGVAPEQLKAYLTENAPDLVQFISPVPTQLEATLYGALAADKRVVIVKFYLKGCGPCTRMQRAVEDVAKQFNDSILIINVELTDNVRYLMQAFNAHGVPTLVFFKDGKKTGQFTGTLTQAELTSKINKLLNK